MQNKSPFKTSLNIRLAETGEEREQVFKLRYKVYIEEMGKTSHYADSHHKTIIEPLDNSAKILAAFYNNRLVGTARNNLARSSNLEYYPQLYQMDYVGDAHPKFTSISGKLMVQKELRGNQIALHLIRENYRQLLLEGIRFDFSECDSELVAYYSKIGYKSIGTLNHPEYGEGTIIMLDLLDLDYLEQINSPLKDICKTFLA
ncbi:N-acyl amino acid synthase FeeM domain-containing protein [Microcoleus sp. herbarium12]|uniref:N-acyl amino acid synthase FeeM domain-containing protein n=1 Tax=Microcoleus sp. herbarium12 TaxID=3055437 RepID=UPI002FD0AFCD